MKKKEKLKLRLWVKVALIMLGIELFAIAYQTIDKSVMQQCVEAGFTEEYCEVSINR